MLKVWMLLVGLMLTFSKTTFAGEKSLYDFLWLDPDKKVYVLQNKLFKKEKTFYFDLGYLANFTSKFQDTQGGAIRTGYYFHEEWGVELFYNSYLNSNNDELKNVRSVVATEPFIRRLNSTYGANLIWSPFYGKVNTFNQIYYFDWSFGLGVAKIDAESNMKTVAIKSQVSTFDKESYTGGIVKSKLKLHLRENVYLGLEYINTYYQAPGPRNPKSDKLRTNTDIVFSVGFSY